MVETRGDELGLQILRAVQDLGMRMERVEVQVNLLGTRMERVEVQVNLLSTRMDRLEVRMNHLVTRVDALTERVDALTERVDVLTERVDVLTGRVDALTERVDVLTGRVDVLTGRVDALTSRMDKQEKWMERLGAEFVHFREEVRGEIRQWRTEMQEDTRRLKKRLEVTSTTVVLMASVLRGPTEFSGELEAHLSELHVS
jgi:chromosome segregation ATPase